MITKRTSPVSKRVALEQNNPMQGLYFAIMVCLLFSSSLFAQNSDLYSAKGEAIVCQDDKMTYIQTVEAARSKAIKNAVSNALGTRVSQITNITIEDGQTDFTVFGSTTIKGKWIATDEETIETTSYFDTQKQRPMIYVSCRIKGKVKEAPAEVMLLARTMRCPDLSCESVSFSDGDNIYLYFKSPVDGYLSVFFSEGNKIYRILPYPRNSSDNYVEVIADKEYIFFSDNYKHNYSLSMKPEKLKLSRNENELDSYKVQVVFSQNKYFKPLLEKDDRKSQKNLLPPQLSSSEFNKWMKKLCVDEVFQCVVIPISVD